MSLNEKTVMDALSKVKDPDLGRSLTSLNMIKDLKVKGTSVSLTVELTTPACPMKDKIEADVKQALEAVGAQTTDINMTSRVRQTRNDDSPMLASVKNVILVASGKGGVGKSTVAANLAAALAKTGAKTGLLDADIYGPSVPLLMGVDGAEHQPEVVVIDGEKRILPIKAHGLEIISMGFFVPPNVAMAWRGPMVHGALSQFMQEVAWGDLDYIILDLPPGTGDVQMTLAQRVQVSGALIVTTPQMLSVADVVRAKSFFDKLKVPMLGVIENMSYFVCPNCDEKHDIFSSGGGERAARQFGLPLLAQIPLVGGLRDSSDNGVPEVIANPDGAVAEIFTDIAQKMAAQLSIQALEDA
ncbi:MAG: chromosome partitioning protein [Deltaproteobacteria bacterium]|nr:chromosome partitioning protein [Deltaproteobacteria bacterium]MBU53011.1 chromosome partitioning protein [Deltaproteobacteria bacterium]|tara:strand:+ start:826 stop:1893 length:1068 start_codon:yes stop_codon:yes gene_type:complete